MKVPSLGPYGSTLVSSQDFHCCANLYNCALEEWTFAMWSTSQSSERHLVVFLNWSPLQPLLPRQSFLVLINDEAIVVGSQRHPCSGAS